MSASPGLEMPASDEPMKLASDFPAADETEWVTLAAKVLNKSRSPGDELDGDEVRRRLRTGLPGGLSTEALYLPDSAPGLLGYPGSMPFTRGIGPVPRDLPWDVRQLHEDPDPVATHDAVMVDLEHGVSSLWLTVGDAGVAVDDLPQVLDDVLLDLAPVAVTGTDDQVAAAQALADLWRSREVDNPRGNLGLDPLGLAVGSGETPDLTTLQVAADLAARFPSAHPIVVDAARYADAGGTAVDVLGCAVATGIAYLRELEGQGVGAELSARSIEFRVPVTDDQFLTTATLRALRRLWATVGEHSGVPADDRGAHIHAVTSWRMVTRDDPYVNILRGTLACFGAAVGGAQAITTLPFDAAAGLPDILSRRIARNTQVVLAEESHISAVADPGGGSAYLEDLTDQVARRAWAWVQELERAGGMTSALTSGMIAERLEASRAEADQALARRGQPLTGVSMYPQLREEPLRRKPHPVRKTGGLPRRRDAEPFEALRDRSAAMAAAGRPPEVFLATLGSHRDYGPRQTFTTSLLAVAGIAAVEGGELASEAARRPMVVLCSSAKGYAEHAGAAVAALREAGAGRIWVAGRAAELGPEVQVDGELYDGVNVLELLGSFLDILDAAPARESNQ